MPTQLVTLPVARPNNLGQTNLSTFAGYFQQANQMALTTIANLGVAGWLFSVEEESRLEINNQVTDNYVQAGYTIQDHMATQPLRFVIRGRVAEVEVRSTISSIINNVARIVGVVNAFQSNFTNYTQNLMKNVENNNAVANSSNTLTNAYNSVFDIYKLAISSLTLFKKQAQIFAFFEALARSGTLITIQTQWRLISNMIIESVHTDTDQRSKGDSSFQITVREFLTTEVKTEQYSSNTSASGVQEATAESVNKGINTGVASKKNVSTLATTAKELGIFNAFQNFFSTFS